MVEKTTDWPGHKGNWGRWPNDRGALNFITPEVTVRAAQSVRLGRVVPCARAMRLVDPANPEIVPAAHEMVYVRDTDGGRGQASGDRIMFRMHGMLNTHIDAFSHVGHAGRAFNGHRFDDVVTLADGAVRLDITDLLGIVTRGVFIDVARARGVTALLPGDCVTPKDLAPLLARLEPGDAPIIRTGVSMSGGDTSVKSEDGTPNLHYPIAGLHAKCVALLAEKGACVIASDGPNDTYPAPVDVPVNSPVHVLSLVYFGLPLIHNMDLEELGRVCAETGRSEFLFMVSALNFPHATGSPCTPLAVL